jgi:hypothetical protein
MEGNNNHNQSAWDALAGENADYSDDEECPQLVDERDVPSWQLATGRTLPDHTKLPVGDDVRYPDLDKGEAIYCVGFLFLCFLSFRLN